MKEVVITKEKEFIERKLDKFVINVENSIVSAGNTVLDILDNREGIVGNQKVSLIKRKIRRGCYD